MCEANAARAEPSLVEAFSSLEDTRCPINRRHHLTDMCVAFFGRQGLVGEMMPNFHLWP